MLHRAIASGVCKVNVNTECQMAFTKAVRDCIEQGKDLVGTGYAPHALLAPGLEATKKVAVEKMRLFGSVGKV